MNKKIISALLLLILTTLACQTLANTAAPEHEGEDHLHTPEPVIPSDNGFPDRDALPNDSGIEGVQTFPDKSIYHDHVQSVEEPTGDVPPAFGAHLGAWQNCGIYDQPVGLGNALHSLEHGAVWLTYSPDLPATDVEYLRDLARGNGYVLMSPYPQQTKPVVLSAWTIQLVIDSLPDERIEKFLEYYVNGPQNPEPGAPCSGAIGEPIE